MSNRIKGRYNLRFRFLIFSLLLLIPVGCEDAVQVQVQDDILGLWELREQSGSATPVCDGELAQFNANGIAGFECPGFDPVTTPYSAVNNVLTFTDTGIQYNISKPADTNLVLTGVNIDKILKYGRR